MLIPHTSITFEDSRKVLSYDEMIDLCNKTENFDYIDESIYGRTTRTFNYRLDIFESFAKVGARNFRGTVYDLESKELLALPFFKFFNYNQSAFTLANIVNQWNLTTIYEKVDGSLIYFYKVGNHLVCRTKRSCTNFQSNRSMQLINANAELKEYISKMIDLGYTPMFEFISPLNEVIVKYNFETLCFLALRNRTTGQLYFADSKEVPIYKDKYLRTYPITDNVRTIEDCIKECKKGKTKFYVLNILKRFRKIGAISKLIQKIQASYRNNIREGYVLAFDNNEIVKMKRLTYISLAKLKDAINSDIAIVQLLFNESLDDVIAEFKDNEQAMNTINMIIKCVNDTWNRWLKNAKRFWEDNKTLERKEYAQKAKKELDGEEFTFAMLNYKFNGKIELDNLKNSYISNRKWRKSYHFVNYNVNSEDKE